MLCLLVQLRHPGAFSRPEVDIVGLGCLATLYLGETAAFVIADRRCSRQLWDVLDTRHAVHDLLVGGHLVVSLVRNVVVRYGRDGLVLGRGDQDRFRPFVVVRSSSSGRRIFLELELHY